jgi:hypothetical protein
VSVIVDVVFDGDGDDYDCVSEVRFGRRFVAPS